MIGGLIVFERHIVLVLLGLVRIRFKRFRFQLVWSFDEFLSELGVLDYLKGLSFIHSRVMVLLLVSL